MTGKTESMLKSDIYYRLLELSKLMKITTDILVEIDHSRADGGRHEGLDSVAAMSRISCREVDQIADMVSFLDRPSKS
jgi:hypothetical protein